ncbi:stereocilin isoform 1-T2 [Synchiropus picturatus]
MRRMGTFQITFMLLCLLLVEQGHTQHSGLSKEEQRKAVFQELISKLSKGGAFNPSAKEAEPKKDSSLHPWVRSIMGGLKTFGLLPPKHKLLDRQRLSGFLYNISHYLQEMGAELEEVHDRDDQPFWEKVLQYFLQSEGNFAFNQWTGGLPPRPSVRLQDWFLSLRGSPHWDFLLGLLQSVMTLSERQPHRPLLTFLSQNWKTVSAVLEAALQALVSGTYGQASAGLQGFICALKGRSDCAFSVGWLQEILQFLETRNWKPVVSLHPADEEAEHRKASGAFERLKPFIFPPEALRVDVMTANDSLEDMKNAEDDSDSMQSFILQALSRSGGSERSGLAQKNLALVQSLDGLRRGLMHTVGSSVYGNLKRKVSRVTMALVDDVSTLVDEPQHRAQEHCSAGNLKQLILWGVRHNVTWNTQALGVTSHSLPSTLPFLSCPSNDGHQQPPSATGASKMTHPDHPSDDIRPQTRSRREGSQSKRLEHTTSSEILEAACNDSIPGLTGVSNFTVFLYCKLFEGENSSADPRVAEMGLDLHLTCSDAAWYLSAAEEDFLWVHVCSEFFAHEFNNTVCANSSFWLQKAHQAALTKNYQFFNQTSIDELCVHLPVESAKSPLDSNCLSQLGNRSLTAQDFRNCFLPNNSALISALCGKGHPHSESLPEGSWASAYCHRIQNSSEVFNLEETCQYRKWDTRKFVNSSLLELCGETEGLREYICLNTSLYNQLVGLVPQFAGFCADLLAGKCLLQRFFDMLPAPYEFDTSQLCVNPGPLLFDLLHKLSVCEVEGGQHEGFLAALGYVLRLLDLMVGLSSGLEEGEREARLGLSQAILVSSLLDNASWTTLLPEASTSVLHTVGVFLRREQNSTVKEDLLSCFSPVLWDLIQQNDNSSALRILMQEYLQMPKERIRSLVMSAEKDAVKRFLSHMHQSWDQLQVETDQASQKELVAMETMTAAFIQKFNRVTPELFIDLSQFIPFMSVSDIMSFPASLIVNDSVLTAIRDHSSGMKSLQKKAFVKRLLQSHMVGDVPSWPPYFLRSVLPLLPFLPVSHFQQLTSQQLMPLVELLGNSSLDGVRGRHVLRRLLPKMKNLTSDDILRLGVLTCYLDPLDIRVFLQDPTVSSVVWHQLLHCISKGFISPNSRLSSLLIPAVQTLNISVMASPEMSALAQLAASFLLSLPSQKLLEVLSRPGLQPFSPAQAFELLLAISKDTNLTMEQLCQLRPLHSGLSPTVLHGLQWPEIIEPDLCACWSSMLTELKPGQRAMIFNAMQEASNQELNDTHPPSCLWPFIPLRSLTDEVNRDKLLRDITHIRDVKWSPQQAQLLFKMVEGFTNVTSETVRGLGIVAEGISCELLRSWCNDTDYFELLQFMTHLSRPLRPALRKCIVEEMKNRQEFELDTLSSWFSATLPVTMVEKLSNTSIRAILEYIQSNFAEFLRLPFYKQTNLAEKAVIESGISDAVGEINGYTLDFLGPLLPFLSRDMLALVDGRALAFRLEEMRSFCLPREALRDIGALLTQKNMLGDPSKWHIGDVEHLGRLVFSLSARQLTSIPLAVLDPDAVEQVLVGQRLWQDSVVGEVCMSRCMDRRRLQQQAEILMRGVVKARSRRSKLPVPTCSDIRGTVPSAWTSTQLNRMSQEDVKQCVEVFGADASLSAEQRRAVWTKLRQSFSPLNKLTAGQILALGSVVTEMGERELQEINLTDSGLLAHLGMLTGWSPKKMRAVILGVMRKRKQRAEQLTVVDLATFGNLICGLYPSEIRRLNPYNLSVAVLFLRQLSLPCTEQQMEALMSRLSRVEAFGPVSAWGPEVFTEIGTLAAGLEDLALSALVRQQMGGLAPEAIALMPPKKIAVVFSPLQLSWLSAEQVWAVTQDQWSELDEEQRHAVDLARYEGDLLELRGRNLAPALTLHSHSFTITSLALMLLLWQLI